MDPLILNAQIPETFEYQTICQDTKNISEGWNTQHLLYLDPYCNKHF